MAIRAKLRRSTPRRRTTAVARRPHRVAGKAKSGAAPSARKHHGNGHSAAHHGPSAYSKAMRFLASLANFERMRIVRYNSQNFDLDRMRSLLRRIGNPHDQFRSIHVAGTKGKGSTCAMIASMLQACGLKVGLYTSPHLVDVRERIRINGDMIPQAEFARLVRQVAPHVNRIKPTPSYFDVLTAVAFKYFADQAVEIAFIETGLGGRLESTNCLKPEITAITSISKDHMAQLGHTLPKIAEEKAGIFKKGVTAITVTQDPGVEDVLKRVAEKVGAP